MIVRILCWKIIFSEQLIIGDILIAKIESAGSVTLTIIKKCD